MTRAFCRVSNLTQTALAVSFICINASAQNLESRVPGAPVSIQAQAVLLTGSEGTRKNSSGALPIAALVTADTLRQNDWNPYVKTFDEAAKASRLIYESRMGTHAPVQEFAKFGMVVTSGVPVVSTVFASVEYVAGKSVEYSKAAYRSSLTDLYSTRLNDLKRLDPKLFQTTRDSLEGGTLEQQRESINFLLTASSTLYGNDPLVGQDEIAQTVALPYHLDLLKTALTREVAYSDQQIGVLKEKIKKEKEAIDEWQHKAQGALDEVSDRLTEAEGGLAVLRETVTTGMQTTNSLLYKNLDPRDRLQALEGPLDLGLTKAQVDDEIKRLKPQVDLLNYQDRVQQISGVGSKMIAVATAATVLAKTIGVEIPPETSEALQTAQTALMLGTAFALGPMAGAQALAGLAGGGSSGPDPQVMAMLGKITEKLNEVIDLQKKTLQRLDEIDARMAENHREIVSRLIKLDTSVDILIDQVFEPTASGLNSCLTFNERVNRVPEQGEERYATLVRNFKNEANWAFSYRNCHNALSQLVDITLSKPHAYWRLQEKAPPSEAGDDEVERMPTQKYIYSPTKELALHYLGLEFDSNRTLGCAGNELMAWKALPKSYLDIPLAAKTPCSFASGTDGGFVPYRRVGIGGEISAPIALSGYVHHDISLEGITPDKPPTLAEMALSATLILAPYYELLTGRFERDKDPELASMDFLRERKEPVNASTARENLDLLTDVLDIAAAQETLMSGAPLAAQIAIELSDMLSKPPGERPFGLNPAGKSIASYFQDINTLSGDQQSLRSAQKRGFDSKCRIPNEEYSSSRLICVLQRQPQMLSNALALLVRASMDFGDAENAGGTTMLNYETARASRNLLLMRLMGGQLQADPDIAASAKFSQTETLEVRAIRQERMLKRLGLVDMKSGKPVKMSYWAEPDGPGVFGVVLRDEGSSYIDAGAPDPGFGWFLKLNTLSGGSWYVQMPTPFEVERLPIRYRPQEDRLLAVRQALADQSVSLSLHLKSEKTEAAPKPVIFWLALKNAQQQAALAEKEKP